MRVRKAGNGVSAHSSRVLDGAGQNRQMRSRAQFITLKNPRGEEVELRVKQSFLKKARAVCKMTCDG